MANEKNNTPTEFPTPEAVTAALSEESTVDKLFTTDEERRIATKLLPVVTSQVQQRLEVDAARKLQATVDELKTENEKLIRGELEKIREANRPPNPEELQKLLSQEYSEFTVRIRERGRDVERTFTIRELPQTTELKLVKSIQKALVPKLKEITSLEWSSTASMAEKIQRVIDMVPELLDTLAETCVICLDPFGEENLDVAWVQRNLSSFRIISIVQSQVVAGKFRDFFLLAFRSIPEQMIG
jgi:hypothetical protein